MSIPRASARETAFGEVELLCPFREGLVEALKEIPGRFRSWDPDEKVWRVREPHAQVAVDLLVEHFPGATVPAAYRRIAPVIVKEPPPAPLPPIVPLRRTRSAHPELDHLVASVQCPRCPERYEQPIRVVAETSLTVAKRERITPELIAICPHCSCLAVVAFWPAAAGAARVA